MTHADSVRAGRAQALTQEMNRRVGSVLASLPERAQPLAQGAHLGQDRDFPTPNWLRLPVWLEEEWGKERTSDLSDAILADLLWGQFALFLCFRVQDDLLDRHRDDLRIVFLADRFLLESLESFQRFPLLDGEFWAFYRQCMRKTIDGILEVQALEEEPGRFTGEHLCLYAKVNAIFKLGTVAMCRLVERDGDALWLSNLLDCLAVFDQICDDLQDLTPDLANGSFTWVANTLMAIEDGESIPPDQWARRLGEGLMRIERGDLILAELRRAVRLAESAIPASAPVPVLDLVRSLPSRIDVLEQGMHEARVRSVFGEVLGGQTAISG